jgi:hypothetical protein
MSIVEGDRGPVDVRQLAPARRTWSFAFSGLHGRADRAHLGAPPGDGAGYERMRALLSGVRFGEAVCALTPLYQDDRTHAGMGGRSLDVYPVRVLGPLTLTHLGYEERAQSGVIQELMDGAALSFEEVP